MLQGVDDNRSCFPLLINASDSSPHTPFPTRVDIRESGRKGDTFPLHGEPIRLCWTFAGTPDVCSKGQLIILIYGRKYDRLAGKWENMAAVLWNHTFMKFGGQSFWVKQNRLCWYGNQICASVVEMKVGNVIFSECLHLYTPIYLHLLLLLLLSPPPHHPPPFSPLPLLKRYLLCLPPETHWSWKGIIQKRVIEPAPLVC